MSKKKQMITIMIIVITLVISIVGATYAYFSVTITGNDNASNIITNAGTLSLIYTDGPEVNATGVTPGWTTTKDFYVLNTGTVAVDYNIVWSELLNEIQNGDLVYSISKTTYSSLESYYSGTPGITTEVLGETTVPLIAGNILTSNPINPKEFHTYTMTLTFLNKSTDQSINQGKTFAGKIEVTTEYMEEPNTLILSETYFTDGFFGGTSPFLESPIQREQIEEVEFVNHKNIPANAISSWDVSVGQNGSIIAWYEPIGTNGRYKITIGSEGEIHANPLSYFLFSYLSNLNSLNFNNVFNTSQVFNMENMFFATGSNSSVFTLDLGENFDTSKVTNMRGMFCDTGGSNHSNIISMIENKIDNTLAIKNNMNYYEENFDGIKDYCNGYHVTN